MTLYSQYLDDADFEKNKTKELKNLQYQRPQTAAQNIPNVLSGALY